MTQPDKEMVQRVAKAIALTYYTHGELRWEAYEKQAKVAIAAMGVPDAQGSSDTSLDCATRKDADLGTPASDYKEMVQRVAKAIALTYYTHGELRWEAYEKQAKAAIAAMGEAVVRFPSGDTSPASDLPSEIPVVDAYKLNDAFNAHISENPRSYESFADYREGFFEGYHSRTTEPVSVDLEKCARALDKAAWGGDYKDELPFLHDVLKAVLDAAGVKYVE